MLKRSVKPFFLHALACALLGGVTILRCDSAERVIDDKAYVDGFLQAADQLEGSSNFGDGNGNVGFSFPQTGGAIVSSIDQLYRDCLPAVVLVGSVYKCVKCTKWHHGGFAGGWIASPEGHVVTNHHVVEKKRNERLGVMTLDGRIYPVQSLCASDPVADIAVVKIDPAGEKLPFLHLAESVKLGADVVVLSHPGEDLFSSKYQRSSRSPARQGHL